MGKKLIGMAFAAIMLFGIFGLTACEEPEATSFEIGFGGRGAAGKINNFFCGAKSDKVVFDINDIEIEFYFGWANTQTSNINGTSDEAPDWTVVPDGYERVAIAAYFYGYSRNGSENLPISDFVDYRNIENRYFIKEFVPDEFYTDKYKATFTSSGLFGKNKKTTFKYCENIKIPSDILNDENGSFYFGIIDILFSQEKSHYIFGYYRTNYDDVRFRYEKKGADQVAIKGYAQK